MNRRSFWKWFVMACLFSGLILSATGDMVTNVQVPQVSIPVYQEKSIPSIPTEGVGQSVESLCSSGSGCNLSISLNGTGPFHPGDMITLTGINPVTDMSYLFITGQNLPQNGGALTSPLVPAVSDQPVTFTAAPVSDADTWSYIWTVPQDITQTGAYSLYVAAAPKNLTNLNDTKSASQIISISVSPQQQVTILVSGAGPFHPGDGVTLSGNNSATDMTYLFISGQNLPQNGGMLTTPFVPSISDQPASFTMASVSGNDTWSYNWTIPQDITRTGAYSLYAAAAPKNLTTLNETISGSALVSISTNITPDYLNLQSGWNFISSPVSLREGNNTMAIFASVNSSGHSILSYEGQNATWVTMKATDIFTPLTGIWIYSTDTIQIPLISDNVTLSPRMLVTGWNTLGITRPDRPVDQALSSISKDWSYVVEYNATLQQYNDPIINDNQTGSQNMLRAKDGMWIYMKNNATYSG